MKRHYYSEREALTIRYLDRAHLVLETGINASYVTIRNLASDHKLR